MKRLGNVWPKITRFDNLYAAFLLARKGKRDRETVIRLELNLERELMQLQQDMAAGYAVDDLDLSDIHCRVNAWIGHARHAETDGLRRRIFQEVVFQRRA